MTQNILAVTFNNNFWRRHRTNPRESVRDLRQLHKSKQIFRISKHYKRNRCIFCKIWHANIVHVVQKIEQATLSYSIWIVFRKQRSMCTLFTHWTHSFKKTHRDFTYKSIHSFKNEKALLRAQANIPLSANLTNTQQLHRFRKYGNKKTQNIPFNNTIGFMCLEPFLMIYSLFVCLFSHKVNFRIYFSTIFSKAKCVR